MGLFDQPDENERKDDIEKNRLFETHQKSGKSFWDYEKFLVPIVVLVIVAIAAAVYFSLPKVGDRVRAPQDLEDAVYDHMLTKEKRTASEMDFNYCDTFYTATITVEPKPLLPNKPADPVTQYKVVASKEEGGTWQINATPMQPKEQVVPCTR
jgi:hypothetical protein